MSEYKPPITGTVPMQLTEGQPVVIAGGVFNTNEAGQTRVSLSLTSVASRMITNVAVMVFGWSEAGEILCREPYTYSTSMHEGDFCGEGIDIDLSTEGIARVTAFPIQVVYADGAIWYIGKGEVSAETATTDKKAEQDEEKKRHALMALWISLGSVALIAIVILCVVLLKSVKRGTVIGTLVDASNPDQRISGAIVVINGQTCITDSNGAFKAVVKLGAVRYTVRCDDYITVDDSFEMIEDEQTITISTSRVMASNEYRVVLTWGEYPSDLDSHLWGQRESGTSYHVYYKSGSMSADNGNALLE